MGPCSTRRTGASSQSPQKPWPLAMRIMGGLQVGQSLSPARGRAARRSAARERGQAKGPAPQLLSKTEQQEDMGYRESLGQPALDQRHWSGEWTRPAETGFSSM